MRYSFEDDDQRFRSLMLEHQSMVFSIALRILGDRSAAEEVAQDVFVYCTRNSASWPRIRTCSIGCAG